MNTNHNNSHWPIPPLTGILQHKPDNLFDFLSLFGISTEGKAEIAKTTAQEDLEAEQERENADTLSIYDVTHADCPERSATSPRLSQVESRKIVRDGVDEALKPATIEASQQTSNMKSLHLVTLVLKRIEHFHLMKLNFSAHDVTRSVREVLAAQEYDLEDVLERDFFDGAFLPVVRHDNVRNIVRELFDENLIPDYTPDISANRPYVLYVYNRNDPKLACAADDVVATTQSTQNIKDEMWEKIRVYVEAKLALGEPPTMKQIQSRMKGYAVTCLEIRDWAVTRGRTVLTNGKRGPVSQDQIIK